MSDPLAKITTQWTQMEALLDSEGPAALANFLAVRYLGSLARQFKKMVPNADDLKVHELTSDVMYEFIKNNYRMLGRLDRDRGKLRGLFFKIIKSKLSKKKSQPELWEELDYQIDQEAGKWGDIYLDLCEKLDQLQQERPKLYQPFVYHYLEGKKLAEIGELLEISPNAVKQRLYSARCWLAESLSEYSDE